MTDDAVDRALKKILQKVTDQQPTTAEDVHLIAVLWAATDHPQEAAAGSTTAADLELLTVVRGQTGAGDAAAHAVCEAAVRWRTRTRLDQGDPPGSARYMLARTVDAHQPRWWQRRRLRVALLLGVLAGVGLIGDGVMSFTDWGNPALHGASILLALVAFLGSMGILAHFHLTLRR